jgi:endonuclease/exonuclease/phosphatase family metal-dependent hydrolase
MKAFAKFWMAVALAAVAAGWAGTARGARRWVTFTVATANLSDSTTQAYRDPGIRLLQALDPDVIGMQEFNFQGGTTADLVKRLFPAGNRDFCRERGGARLPNGVISRFPVLAWGQWEDPYVKNRQLFWATVRLSGRTKLHVVSVHLVQNRANRRIPEADYLVQCIRKQFPAKDYVVLCGDLNTSSRETGVMAVLGRMFDLERVPADQKGNPNTNSVRTHPYDVVLPNRALAPYEVRTVVGGMGFPDGIVFDTRLWARPPFPSRKGDADGNLQHLPVMKTFRVPVEE